MTSAPPKSLPTLARHLGRAALLLGALGLSVVVLFLAALLYVQTPAGTRRLLDLGLGAANNAIAGRVEARSVTIHGTQILIRGASLLDPEGARVAFIEEAEVQIEWAALLQGHIEARTLLLRQPELSVVVDAEGSNLDRTFAPRYPGPPDTGGKPVPLTFVVHRLHLEEGRLHVKTPDGPPFLAQALVLDGSGRYALRSQAFQLDVRGNGAADSPTPGPLSVAVRGEGSARGQSAEVDIRAAGASLVADLRFGGEVGLAGHVALDVAPNLGRALVRGWPLRVPLSLTGEAQREGEGYRIALQAAAGKARLELRAQMDLQQTTAHGLDLQLQHVDAAELFGRGPKSDFSARLQGSVRGNSLASARGTLELAVPASRVRGAQVGPVQVSLRLDAGRLDVPSLRAVLPGLQLQGSGHGTTHSLEGTLQLEVADLHALGDTLGELSDGFPRLAGQGMVRLTLSGHPAHPGVEAEGDFPRLQVGPLSAQALRFGLQLKDLSQPLDAIATVEAEALGLGSRLLRDVHATLGHEGRAVQLQLFAAGPVQLTLAGTADGDGRGLRVETLVVRFPEEAFSLAAPAAVRFGEARFETQPLRLLSDQQALSFSVQKAQAQLEAQLEVARLDLARLPALVAPASWGLAGVLDATASLHGEASHPDVTLSANLAEGGWHGLSGLQAHLEGQRTKGQLTLQGHLQALGSALDVDFQGPELALSQRLHRPLALHLAMTDVDVGGALCQLAKAQVWNSGCPAGEAAVRGRASLQLAVDGFADGPSIHFVLRTTDVAAGGLSAAEGTLRLQGDAETPVTATLSAKALQGDVQAQVSLASTSTQLLLRRRTWEGWRTLPVQADVHASGLRLATLHQAKLVSADLQGVAQLAVSASGTLGAPRGTADVEVHALALPPWPVLDVHLSVQAAETVQARLSLVGPDEEKGSVQLRVEAPLARLVAGASPEALAEAGLSLQGDVGPFNLREMPFNVNRLRRDRRQLDGKLQVQFEGKGTLLAPTLTATLQATNLGPSGGAHFEGKAKARYADGQGAVAVQLQSASGGTLDIDGTVHLDLGLPSLRRGLHLFEAPLQAKLHSVRFEPDFVAAFIPSLRSISGQLQLEAQADGTLGRPQLQGSVAWKDGALGIIGFGLYQDIQLRASATNQRFSIEELFTRVQGGTVALQLQGERAAEGFQLSGTLRAKDFPVVLDDQLWCIATLSAELHGLARPWELDLRPVVLSQVEVQLPEVRRKNLQDLNPPPDVILTRNGVPLDAGKALRALALDPRRRTGAASPGASSAEGVFLRLSLQTPQPVWVRSKDVTLELTLSNPFTVALGGQTDIHGEVRLLQGRGDVWGRRFEVQSGGQVRFAGLPQQGLLDVTGVYSSVLSQAKVYMHLSGEISNAKLTPSSEPPMSETEIYTLLATGRTSLTQSSLGSSTSVGGGEAGASVLGSWAATQLKTAVGVALPIDVLSVEVGSDERGVNQTRLEAGKYLNDDIYIGYQARTNADPFRYQNANAIRVEYRFLRRWSLQLEYGDANAGSLDAVWSRDY